jgi:acetoin utilization deacetylase AcuC-like enzyme
VTVAFSTDELYFAHQPPGGVPHPERSERLAAILERLEQTGLLERMQRLPPRDATDGELLAVHDRSLLETVEAHAAAGGGWIDPDTFVGPSSPAAARRACGAVLAATDAVLDGDVTSAFVAARPCGHHATRDRAMGFCLYNQVAVAAAAALDRGVERLAIVDWDLHHGNGTQAIFDADPRVLYVSTHAYPYYPGTGALEDRGVGEAAGTKINVPLPHGAGDAAFHAAYERVAVPALEAFAPELVLVSCGWDSHARDPLGPLAVSTAGYTAVARLIIDAAARLCDGRLVAVLEGGYDEHALACCAQALCELLLGDEPTPDPEQGAGRPELVGNVDDVIAAARAAAGLD